MGSDEHADDRRDGVGGEDADDEQPGCQLALDERLRPTRAVLHPATPVGFLCRVVTQAPPDHERRDHDKACGCAHDVRLVEPGSEEDRSHEAADQTEREGQRDDVAEREGRPGLTVLGGGHFFLPFRRENWQSAGDESYDCRFIIIPKNKLFVNVSPLVYYE